MVSHLLCLLALCYATWAHFLLLAAYRPGLCSVGWLLFRSENKFSDLNVCKIAQVLWTTFPTSQLKGEGQS